MPFPDLVDPAAVLEPRTDVQSWIRHVALHHPGVDAVRRQPRRDPRTPVLSFDVHPRCQQCCRAAGVQVVDRARDHQFARTVEIESGIAVRVMHACLADDKRGIGDHLVESSTLDGFEPGPLKQFDVQSVEGHGCCREVDGALIDVGCGDRIGVRVRVQGLDAASGTEVEHAADLRGGSGL